MAFRGAFLIDKEGVVRSQIVNDLPLGRNMDELLRLVDALQFHEEHGEVCPANWKKGDKGMTASPEGVAKVPGRERQQAVRRACSRVGKAPLRRGFSWAREGRQPHPRSRASLRRGGDCLTESRRTDNVLALSA